MTHIGILCPPIPGHLNPMIALGRILQQHGHSISVIGWERTQAIVEAAGLCFIQIESSNPPDKHKPEQAPDHHINWMHKLCQLRQLYKPWKSVAYSQVSGLVGTGAAFSVLKQFSGLILREVPAIIKQNNIDALLVSEILYGAGTIAEYTGIPYITVSLGIPRHRANEIPPYITSWAYRPILWAYLRNELVYRYLDWLNRPTLKLVNKYRQDWGLENHKYLNDEDSSLAQLIQIPKELDFPLKTSPHIHFTGPFINYSTQPYFPKDSAKTASFPFERLTDKPLVYASIGTLANKVGVYQCIAEACSRLDVQLVISLGGIGNVKALADLPGNPIVVDYAPMPETLHRTSLVVTHGGINTALEALQNGIPLVIIPIVLDQPGMAARIKRCGAGEFIALRNLNAKRLQRLIQDVLQKPAYKNKAAQLQAIIAHSGGTHRAIKIISKALVKMGRCSVEK